MRSSPSPPFCRRSFFDAGAQQPASENDNTALLKLEQSWADAVAKHDAAFIERVEDDAYVYTDAAGSVAHKADDLASARAGDVKIESFKLADMKVQVHGDAAVVTGETMLVGSDHGGALNGTYRWTDTFVRRPGGNWQVVASQATAVGKAEEAPVIAIPAETPRRQRDGHGGVKQVVERPRAMLAMRQPPNPTWCRQVPSRRSRHGSVALTCKRRNCLGAPAVPTGALACARSSVSLCWSTVTPVVDQFTRSPETCTL